jgi:predicted enzyme related to lactoylglutathione lyase
MKGHSIVHVELSARDRKALGQFYSQVFGWELQHMDEMNYTTFTAGDGVGGGFNPITAENPAGTITIYIGTDDIAASLSAVEQAGGTILVKETEIPNTGWFGMFRDPQGNMVGLYKANPKMG